MLILVLSQENLQDKILEQNFLKNFGILYGTLKEKKAQAFC